MPTLSFDQLQIVVVAASLFLLGIIIYFTLATPRRVAGALIGGLGFGALNVAWDEAAFYAGWWHYPFTMAPYATLPLYLADAVFYGAGVALVGWRVNRRFGGRGLLLFLLLFTVYGIARDFGGAAATHHAYIIFGVGVLLVLADAAAWAIDAALAQLLMRLVVGPAAAEPLARPSKGHHISG
jgi:hypothetical protein